MSAWVVALAVPVGVPGDGAAAAATGGRGVAVERYAGADRYATALAVAGTFPRSATAVVVSGETFGDAISANALAGALQAPVLLTRRDRLPDGVAAELERLGVAEVVVVGGPDAVDDTVVDRLVETGRRVRRVAGADRVATSVAVAGEVGAAAIRGHTVFLARADEFADGVAAGAPSYAGSRPILLTPRDRLDARVVGALRDLGIRRVVALGGSSALDEQVLDAVRAEGIEVVRVAGADRFATAARLADLDVAAEPSGFGLTATTVTIATGLGFADSLAAGALSAPIVLTGADVPAVSHRWVDDHFDVLTGLRVVGGSGAVSEPSVAALRSEPGCQDLVEPGGSPRPRSTVWVATPEGTHVPVLDVYGQMALGWGVYARPGAICAIEFDPQFRVAQVRKVADLPAEFLTVSWLRPDATGSKLLVTANVLGVDGGYPVLAVVDLAAGTVRIVADHTLGPGAWSPDGSRVAYAADTDADGVGQAATVASDGTGRKEMCAGFDARDVTWSPDGTRLAVAGPAGLQLCTADGASVWPTPMPGLTQPSWRPDGTTIAATRTAARAEPPYWHDPGPDQDVVLVDPAAPPTQTPVTLYGGDTYDFEPVWSPAGDALSFRRGPGYVCFPLDRLHVAQPPAAPIAVVGDTWDDSYAEQYAWSPDGTHLTYTTPTPRLLVCQ